jgi:hypothetical protein
MAWVKPDDEKQEQQGQGVNVSAPSAILSGGGAGGAAPEKKTPSASGMFTNLNQYLLANQGKSEQFADNVVGAGQTQVNNAQNVAQGEIDTFTNNAKGTDTSSYVPLVDKAKDEVGTWTPDSEPWKQVFKVLNPDKTETNLTYKDETLTGLQDAQKLVDEATSYAGQKNMQQTLYGQKGISAVEGEQGFDNFLLNKDTAANTKLNDFSAKNSGVLKTYGSEADKEGTVVKAAEGAAQKVADQNVQNDKDATSTLSGAYDKGWKNLTDFTDPNSKAYGAAAGANAAYEEARGKFTDPDLNPDTYINKNPNQMTWRNVASPEERAQMAALSTILGGYGDDAFTAELESYDPFTTSGDYEGDVAKAEADRQAKLAQKREEERAAAIPAITTENPPPAPGETQPSLPGTDVPVPVVGSANVDTSGQYQSDGSMTNGNTTGVIPWFETGTMGTSANPPAPSPPPVPMVTIPNPNARGPDDEWYIQVPVTQVPTAPTPAAPSAPKPPPLKTALADLYKMIGIPV